MPTDEALCECGDTLCLCLRGVQRAAVEAGKPSYQKPDGTPCTLEWLVRNEPEWAANRIRVGHRHLRERDEALAEIARLKQRMEMDAAERALLALVPKGPQP